MLLSSMNGLSCVSYLPRFTMPTSGLRLLDIWISSTQVTWPDLGDLLTSLLALTKQRLECDDAFKFQWVENRMVRSHQSLRSLCIAARFASSLGFDIQFLSLLSRHT